MDSEACLRSLLSPSLAMHVIRTSHTQVVGLGFKRQAVDLDKFLIGYRAWERKWISPNRR